MKRQRLLASMAALVLVASAFAVALTPAGADTPSYSGTEWVVFPWVSNGENLDGTGPWYATITIQNLEDETIDVGTGTTVGSSSNLTTISAKSSKTFQASDLGVGSPGGPLAISADFVDPQTIPVDDHVNPPDDWESDEIPVPPKISAVMKLVSPEPSPSGAGTTSDHMSVDGHTAVPAQDIAWGPQSEFCEDVAPGDDHCNNLGAFTHGEPEGGFDGHSYLPIVQTNDEWNSILHVSNIDASSPSAATVTMKFYATDQQGVFSSENDGIEFTQNLDQGESWTFDMAEKGFPDDWVGSVWIVSDYTMAASVNRLKAETDMLLTNTAAPSASAITAIDGLGPWDTNNISTESSDGENADLAEVESEHFHGDGRYEMFGPLVFRDYNGWNTGISVVNLSEQTNDVDIQFYGTGGGASVFQDSLTISPKGQDLVYIPNNPELNGNDSFVGSVKLSSDAPFHAAIDQVKYGNGQAMSYIATAAGAEYMGIESLYQETLSLPLAQKGSEMTGLGDTSGIQLFNIDPDNSVKVEVEFYNQSGNLSQPTQNEPIEMTLQPHENTTLYAMNFSGMAPNFIGSAVVTPVDGDGEVVGVSNNVNYDVEGDGAVAFNMANSLGQFRFPQSQTQPEAANITLDYENCDYAGEDVVPDSENNECVVGSNATVVATVTDNLGQVMPFVNVNFTIDSNSPAGDTDGITGGSALTNTNGQARLTFTNDEAVTNTVDASVSGVDSDSVDVKWIEDVPSILEVEVFEEDEAQPDGDSLGMLGSTSASDVEWVYLETTVTDSFGNPIEAEDVTFAVDPDVANASDRRGSFHGTNSGAFDPNDTSITVQTDADGDASIWYLQKAGFRDDEAYIVVTGPNELEVDGVIDFDM